MSIRFACICAVGLRNASAERLAGQNPLMAPLHVCARPVALVASLAMLIAPGQGFMTCQAPQKVSQTSLTPASTRPCTADLHTATLRGFCVSCDSDKFMLCSFSQRSGGVAMSSARGSRSEGALSRGELFKSLAGVASTSALLLALKKPMPAMADAPVKMGKRPYPCHGVFWWLVVCPPLVLPERLRTSLFHTRLLDLSHMPSPLSHIRESCSMPLPVPCCGTACPPGCL